MASAKEAIGQGGSLSRPVSLLYEVLISPQTYHPIHHLRPTHHYLYNHLAQHTDTP